MFIRKGTNTRDVEAAVAVQNDQMVDQGNTRSTWDTCFTEMLLCGSVSTESEESTPTKTAHSSKKQMIETEKKKRYGKVWDEGNCFEKKQLDTLVADIKTSKEQPSTTEGTTTESTEFSNGIRSRLNATSTPTDEEPPSVAFTNSNNNNNN